MIFTIYDTWCIYDLRQGKLGCTWARARGRTWRGRPTREYVGGGDTTTGGGGESRSPLYCTSPPSSARIVSEAGEREIQWKKEKEQSSDRSIYVLSGAFQQCPRQVFRELLCDTFALKLSSLPSRIHIHTQVYIHTHVYIHIQEHTKWTILSPSLLVYPGLRNPFQSAVQVCSLLFPRC